MAKKDKPKSYSSFEWSDQALTVLEERYLAKDLKGNVMETPEGMCYRVAKRIAFAEKSFKTSPKQIEKLTQDFYEMIGKKWFLPNSPTLMNAGRDDSLQYSACFVLPIYDSIIGIFDALKGAALIHKSGGGTGFDFSSLRPRGSIVGSTRGVASGPISFMRIFDASTAEVKQGGMRRGANMGILRVDHPDILEFINCKSEGGITNFNISVAVDDKFMRAVSRKGTYWLHDPLGKKKIKKLKAKEVFDKIIERAWQSGDPGLIFLTTINKGPANPVPSMGPVSATNPCVVGSTLVATEKGLITIEELVKKKMEVKILTDNRVLGSKGVAFRTHNHLWDNGEKEVWRMETKSGFTLLATPDHKIMTTNGWVPLAELQPGQDKVLIQPEQGSFNQQKNLPFTSKNVFKGKNGKTYHFNLPQEWSLELGQVLGWLVGDGWLRRGDKNCRVGFTFAEDDKEIMKHLQPIINKWYGREIKPVKRDNGVWHLSYHSKYFVDFFEKLGVKPMRAEKKEVPSALFTASEDAVIGFLQELFSADGTVRDSRKSNSDWVALTSKSKKLLQGVQLLLLNLGIKSRIFNRSRKPRKGMFPYRAKDGQWRTYTCDGILYELGIFGDFREEFKRKIGFINSRKQNHLKNTRPRFRLSHLDPFLDLVVLVEKYGQENVYDLTEQVTHSVIVNGIIGHQCGEQPLYSNEACNLGSINLSLMLKKNKKDIDWDLLEKVTRLATRFLDNVIEINNFPLEEINKVVKLNRRVGLGVMGWADLLFQLEIPYDSQNAYQLGQKIMKFIKKIAHNESQELAKDRGSFPNFSKSIYKKGAPLRNATLTTIAPTGSLSIIAGCSSGIEPLFALSFKHKANERELTFFNPRFLKAAEKYKLSDEVLSDIEKTGSLEGTDVPQKLKKVFVIAHQIDWKGHIDTQVAFQKGVDNAVSKTINLPYEADQKEIEKAYLYAHKKGCLGITVYRDGCKEIQVLYAGKGTEQKGKEDKPKMKARPGVISGKTYRIETPVGTAYVVINTTEGEPFEVFINVGKAGSDIAADAEAIGRLVSLNLRLGFNFSSRDVLKQIIDQLEGIGGGESVGFGKNRILSLADGVAKSLKEYLVGPQDKEESAQVGEQASLLNGTKKRRDLCPSCGRASLIYEEGCAKCLYCGFNKC